jgi:hypothetical protein
MAGKIVLRTMRFTATATITTAALRRSLCPFAGVTPASAEDLERRRPSGADAVRRRDDRV